MEYGWPGAIYSTAEALFGEDHVASSIPDPGEAGEMLAGRIISVLPGVSPSLAAGFIG